MNKYCHLFALTAALGMLNGCNVRSPENEHHSSDSSVAVLHALDPRQKNFEYASFRSIDGKSLNCAPACPRTVRLRPGSHSFVIRVKSTVVSSDGGSHSFEVQVPASAENMEAGKVYSVGYITDHRNKGISAHVNYSPKISSSYVSTSHSGNESFDVNKRTKITGGKSPKKKNFISENVTMSSGIGAIDKKGYIAKGQQVVGFVKDPKSSAKAALNAAKNNVITKITPEPIKKAQSAQKTLGKFF